MTATTNPADRTDVKTLEIDPEDIVSALRACLNPARNDQEIKISESLFTGEFSYKIVQHDPGAYYPSDVSNPPVHKSPKAFIDGSPGRKDIPWKPTLADARDAVESPDQFGEDVDECFTDLMQVWGELVQREIADEVEFRGETIDIEIVSP